MTVTNFPEQPAGAGERLFRTIVENGTDCIALTDITGKISYCSPSFRQMLGFTENEQAALNAFDLIHPEDLSFAILKLKECVLDPGTRLQGIFYRAKHRNGNWLSLESSFTSFLHDATVGAVIMNCKNRTEELALKQQQEKLIKELEERNATIEIILQNLPIGIAVNNIDDGNITVINRCFSETYGWGGEDIPDIPGFFQQVYPDEAYRKEIMHRVMEDIDSRDATRMTWNNIAINTKAGERKIINAKNIPLYDQHLMISTVLDVTREAVQAEELKQTRARLHKIMDSSMDIICSVSSAGYILSISAAAETLLGYSVNELTGRLLFDFVYEQDLAKTKLMAEQVMSGMNTINFINRYKRKDGSLIPLSWSVRWDPEDQVRYGVARDATERVNSEAALMESEQKYRYLFENNPLPIFMWDVASLQIVDCNREAEITYGYTKEEFLQLSIKDIGPFEDHPLIDEPAKTEESSFENQRKLWRHKKKNGEIIFVHITSHLMNLHSRKVALALSMDVTESRYYTELEKLEKNILEMNSGIRATLREVIESYLSGIEILHPGMLCSIHEKRGNQLFNIASPSLPRNFTEAIEGIEIGENSGSCGTAAFLKKKVIVTDIANDRRWLAYRHLAERNNLKTCWSHPILDAEGNVMATLASYYHDIRFPAEREQNTIDRAQHILQVILENFRRERALYTSNERFEYVTQATADIIWDWNLETNTVYYSGNLKKLFGYEPENNHEVTYYHEYVHPDDRERVLLYPDQVRYGTMINWTREYRFKKADGGYAYVLDKGIVIRDHKNEGTRMVGAIRDITRQKQEEHRLKLFESVVENTTDAILVTEAELLDEPGPRILYANKAFSEMTGYDMAEVIGKTPRMLQGANSDKQQLKLLSEALRNHLPYTITVVNYKKNGEEFWNSFSVNYLADEKGNFTHIIAIERDITHRKNEELQKALLTEKVTEALKERNTILESIGDAFFAVDENWTVTYWNKIAERDLQKARSEILGSNLWDVFSDAMESLSYKLYHTAIETKQSVHFEDYYEQLMRWYEVSAYPSGNGLSVYFKDITQRKHSEIELKSLNDNLQEQATNLIAINNELEQFAYVASHDLQEPLRMVSSFLTQIERKYNSLLDDRGKQYIHFAVDGAKRMRLIILDLLEFSRVGRVDTAVEEVDMNQLTRGILALYQKEIEEKEATITCGNLPVIRTYKVPMRQVIQNLISNSLKYIDSNRLPVISIQGEEHPYFWQFSVTDNGIGISPRFYDKIFIIFQRLHNKEEYSGTGMGLAITKKIIESLGGKIWLESEEGTGSTFFFTLLKK